MLLSSSRDGFLPLCSCTTHIDSTFVDFPIEQKKQVVVSAPHHRGVVCGFTDGVAVVDGVQSWNRARDTAYNLLGAHTEA